MKIAYLTAGAAGMFCGSCLHDNALAKSLMARGNDVVFVPVYTPIRTDEQDVSQDELFYGGLSVYLQQLSPVFRFMPRWMDKALNSPRLVNWLASRGMETSAKNLGALTVSMLRGIEGNQRKEVERLCDWLQELAPDVVVFSNLLIAGCIPELKKRLASKVVVILQGDDIFYDGLIEPFREQALVELRKLSGSVDRFICHSEDYARRMSKLLESDREQFSVSPLSIDFQDYRGLVTQPNEQFVIGYLARLAPEKGLHLLVDAFIHLKRESPELDIRLEVAGWLGEGNRKYAEEQHDKIHQAGLAEYFQNHGEVDRQQKLSFLSRLDVLCVPTTYAEPKGLFVLEGLAAGVPYIQPNHGAFPEMHSRAQAGILVEPNNVQAIVDGLEYMLDNPEQHKRFKLQGKGFVEEHASTVNEAERFEGILQELLVVGTVS